MFVLSLVDTGLEASDNLEHQSASRLGIKGQGLLALESGHRDNTVLFFDLFHGRGNTAGKNIGASVHRAEVDLYRKVSGFLFVLSLEGYRQVLGRGIDSTYHTSIAIFESLLDYITGLTRIELLDIFV